MTAEHRTGGLQDCPHDACQEIRRLHTGLLSAEVEEQWRVEIKRPDPYARWESFGVPSDEAQTREWHDALTAPDAHLDGWEFRITRRTITTTPWMEVQ
jgi:hypothetical protein